MATWDEQLIRYFVQASDAAASGGAPPHTSEGNLVTPHIDGYNYFRALKLEIDFLLAIARSDPPPQDDSDPFFYVIGWWLGLVEASLRWVDVDAISAWGRAVGDGGSAFRLFDGSEDQDHPAPLMIDKLQELSAAGVDVRVMGWVSPLLLGFEAPGENNPQLFAYNINTIRSVEEIRRRNGPRTAALITIGHPLGSMHLKTIVAGTKNSMRAYVGGIDLQNSRAAGTDHLNGLSWHDAAAQISGPAAEAIYATYRDLWNEQIDRPPDRFRLNDVVIPSHFTTEFPSTEPPAIMAPISERQVVSPNSPGSYAVQVLRTLPQMNRTFSNPETLAADFIERFLVLGSGRGPFSFAPDGIFEFSVALHHAIEGAEKYIYIEDQGCWSVEVMGWLNARLKAVPTLKVIIVWGPDTADRPSSFPHNAISNVLIENLDSPLTRIRFFHRQGITVHSKITIVDDLWAAIGSANCTRRSQYTDGELSVSVMEDSPTPFAKVLRKDLWGELCGIEAGPQRDALLDLDLALAVVDPTWSAAIPPPTLRLKDNLKSLLLPFEYASPPGPGQWPGTAPIFDQFEYDMLDADSR